MKHIFTVIVPVYNRKFLLEKLLKSLQNQTYAHDLFEVLVVDDGSTEDLSPTIQKFKQFLQIKHITQINQGPAVARQTGAQHANSDWLAFIDSDCIADQLWLQNAHNHLHFNLTRHNQDSKNSSSFQGSSERSLGAIEGRTEIPNPAEVDLFSHQTQNLNGGKYPTCNFFIRRELCQFYPKYGPKYYFREDSDLAFQILASGYRIDFLKKAVVYHPVFPGNLEQKFRLAKRYRYDALLAKRFPNYYKNTIDCFEVNKLGGLKVRHFRTKLYTLYLLFVPIPLLLGYICSHCGMVSMFLIPALLLALPQLCLTLVMAYPAPQRAFFNIWQFTLLYFASPLIVLTWAGNKLLGKWKFRKEKRFEPV